MTNQLKGWAGLRSAVAKVGQANNPFHSSSRPLTINNAQTAFLRRRADVGRAISRTRLFDLPVFFGQRHVNLQADTKVAAICFELGIDLHLLANVLTFLTRQPLRRELFDTPVQLLCLRKASSDGLGEFNRLTSTEKIEFLRGLGVIASVPASPTQNVSDRSSAPERKLVIPFLSPAATARRPAVVRRPNAEEYTRQLSAAMAGVWFKLSPRFKSLHNNPEVSPIYFCMLAAAAIVKGDTARVERIIEAGIINSTDKENIIFRKLSPADVKKITIKLMANMAKLVKHRIYQTENQLKRAAAKPFITYTYLARLAKESGVPLKEISRLALEYSDLEEAIRTDSTMRVFLAKLSGTSGRK